MVPLEEILAKSIEIKNRAEQADTLEYVQLMGQRARELVDFVALNYTEAQLRPYLFSAGEVLPNSRDDTFSGVISSALYTQSVKEGRENISIVIDSANGGWGARISCNQEGLFFYNKLNFAEILDGAIPKSKIINSAYGALFRKGSARDSDSGMNALEHAYIEEGAFLNSKNTEGFGDHKKIEEIKPTYRQLKLFK